MYSSASLLHRSTAIRVSLSLAGLNIGQSLYKYMSRRFYSRGCRERDKLIAVYVIVMNIIEYIKNEDFRFKKTLSIPYGYQFALLISVYI